MAGKVGAPYGNKNAAGKRGHVGPGTKAYRAHASAHINWASPKLQKMAKQQAKERRKWGF